MHYAKRRGKNFNENFLRSSTVQIINTKEPKKNFAFKNPQKKIIATNIDEEKRAIELKEPNVRCSRSIRRKRWKLFMRMEFLEALFGAKTIEVSERE